jgi:hypothetical protein
MDRGEPQGGSMSKGKHPELKPGVKLSEDQLLRLNARRNRHHEQNPPLQYPEPGTVETCEPSEFVHPTKRKPAGKNS